MVLHRIVGHDLGTADSDERNFADRPETVHGQVQIPGVNFRDQFHRDETQVDQPKKHGPADDVAVAKWPTPRRMPRNYLPDQKQKERSRRDGEKIPDARMIETLLS